MDRPARLMDRRRQDARTEIVAIAHELFVRDGFEATTVEAIAGAAGCATRTFYRYFGSKEDVMFHDLPDVIAGLEMLLDTKLAAGTAEWTAVSESLIDFIGRFDAADARAATQRMDLWLHEPALRARYLQYVAQTEAVVVDSLCRHRGTSAEKDDVANLMAVAAVGAYRVIVSTHRGRAQHKLGDHLRDALATLGAGLGRSK
ncbi:TetR family transcriptional regulator [Mycobacterium sp.]|uniref:acyl-CoA-like ligand-binding transcription factor n=1 Tax=Mycobacterium sp. TaxID=1785 RepID=UPI0025FECA03|nr:TetR family transcriptional regulator [Mycobacterium sp.]